MVTPSAPRLGSVNFEFLYPTCRAPKGALLETDEEKAQLCDATDEIMAGFGFLRGIDINFGNGSVILTAESQHDSEVTGTVMIDILATKFFRDNESYIADINPSLASRIQNDVLTKDVRKICDIFYLTYHRYLQQQTNEQGELDHLVENSTIISTKPGFKNFCFNKHLEDKYVTSFKILKETPGENFKKCIQKLPHSLLNPKGFKKAAPFLEASLDLKHSYSDKLLYLRQVLFLLTFQDAFQNILQTTQQNLSMDKHMLYTSPARDLDISQESQYLQKRIELIETTLAQFPVNDVAMLIPLACRSSLLELNEHYDFLENGNTIEKDYLVRECANARKADIAMRQVLQKSFDIVPKNFSINKNDWQDADGMESIESYLMGISGLAISPGLMGRLSMQDHRTIYYKRDSLFNIPNVSDNFPIEFLMTAAQFYTSSNDDWIEEKCLAYVTEMMGKISLHELETIKCKIQHIRQAVQKAPVDILLKQRSINYILRDSGLEKLQSLHKTVREQVGLPPQRGTQSSLRSFLR